MGLNITRVEFRRTTRISLGKLFQMDGPTHESATYTLVLMHGNKGSEEVVGNNGQQIFRKVM